MICSYFRFRTNTPYSDSGQIPAASSASLDEWIHSSVSDNNPLPQVCASSMFLLHIRIVASVNIPMLQ